MKRKKERLQSVAVRDGDVWGFERKQEMDGFEEQVKKRKKIRGERVKSVGVKAGGQREKKKTGRHQKRRRATTKKSLFDREMVQGNKPTGSRVDPGREKGEGFTLFAGMTRMKKLFFSFLHPNGFFVYCLFCLPLHLYHRRRLLCCR